MRQVTINSIGKLAARSMFIISITLLALYFCLPQSISLTPNGFLSAFFLIVSVGLFSLGILIILIFKTFNDWGNRNGYLKISGVILLNILLGFLCVVVIGTLHLFALRVDFINETEKPLTEIRILGSDTFLTFNKLDANAKKSSWIKIVNDDYWVTIEYKIDGEVKREKVFLVCRVHDNIGERITFRIGTDLMPIRIHI